MLFTTPLFLFLFLPITLILYYAVPAKSNVRNCLLLLMSMLFFAWGEPIFVFVLIIGTFIDYRISLLIGSNSGYRTRARKLLLSIGIFINVLGLILSKYVDFIVEDVINPYASITGLELTPPHIPLILGISFITFHRISYLVDSYKGRAIPPRGFLDCALYIFLFPQLIAGPIIRYHDIGSQIQSRVHTSEGFLTGFNRFSFGLVKKLMIADPIGVVVDQVFAIPADTLPATYAWGAMLGYTLQIYFDFSAYSDMAIGLARMFGFRFPENFNRPYISLSTTEFWQRWHISLSRWMRQYLYIPLGGNRISSRRTYINLWIVFLISGIWHGPSWNFVAWGAYYGFFLSIERYFTDQTKLGGVLPNSVQWLATFLIVMVGWVLFRSPTLEYAAEYIGSLFGYGSPDVDVMLPPWGMVFDNRSLVAMVVGFVFAVIPSGLFKKKAIPSSLSAAWSEAMTISGLRQTSVQLTISVICFIVGVAAMSSSGYVPFLYFRF